MAHSSGSYAASRRTMEEDIRTGAFRRCYLICGEDDYLRDQTGKKLINALSDGMNTMNVNRFAGENTREEELIDLAETLPFFADYRLIVVEDAPFFAGGDHPLADYLKDAAETVRFVFVASEVDRRAKLFKAVESEGLVISCDTPSDEEIATWIAVKCKQEEKKITRDAVTLLMENVGCDMMTLSQELQKLLAYTGDRNGVTKEDVLAVCATNITGQIFRMTDAISEGDREKALDLYYDLLALKESSQYILSLITRQFNLMLQVKELSALRLPYARIAQETGLRDFLVKRYEGWARRYPTKELVRLLQMCADNDEAVKTGRLNDRICVEMLILQATQG